MYKNLNMTPRLSGHISIFGLVFFVRKSLLGIARQWSREKFAILTLKPRSHVRILIYRTWTIGEEGQFYWKLSLSVSKSRQTFGCGAVSGIFRSIRPWKSKAIEERLPYNNAPTLCTD